MTYNCLGMNRSLYTVFFLFGLVAASATLGSVLVGFDSMAPRHPVTQHLI